VVASALGVALAYGALDQGGFYLDQSLNLLGLVAVALLARVLVGPRRAPAYLVGCVAAWLGFAGWTILGAATHGELAAGLPAAAVAGCLAAAAWAAVGLAGAGRRLLTAVVVAVGLVVAASGWTGVALHRPPLALPSSGLWRAASTLTYANAAAALLVTTILVALAVLPASRRRLSALVLAVLLLGLGTTMSRAGALALAVGLAVAATAPVLRHRMADSWPALPAAAIGFAGLLPSLPETADSTVKTGLQVGLVILAGGALMLSGGVAMAMPSAAPPAAHAECSVVQLPGMDVQLGEPGACVSVLLPPGSARNPATQEPTSPVAATTASEPSATQAHPRRSGT
jgi:hypothetical protein